MRKSSLLLAITFIAVTAASAMVYADSNDSSSSMMGGAMMGRGMIDGMMGRMSRMMGGCDAMMHSDARSSRPNEQWRDRSRAPDEDN